MDKKIILKYSLIILTIGCSFFAWNSIDRAINTQEASVWLAPVIFFSLEFIFLGLTIVLVKERLAIFVASFFVIFFSALFTFNIWHLALLLLGLIFLSISIAKIRDDLNSNIRVDFYKSIRAGSTFMILALSLVISSHYFFETKNTRLENIIPKFDISGVIGSITPKILEAVNPEFKNINQNNLSVDQWILESEKTKLEETEKVNPIIGMASKEIILQEGRAQFENFVGFEITGKEKVADVLTKMVSNRLSNFIAPDYSEKKFPIIPLAVSLALFLTLFSLGSFVRPFWTWIAQFIFWLLKKMKLVEIVKKMEEVEVIQ